MLTYLIYTLIVLGIIHFVYEAIIAPSLRLRIRYKLFELRDELRNLVITDDTACTDDVYDYLESSINVMLKYLHKLGAPDFFRAVKELESDPGLEKRAKKRLASIQECKSEEIKQIHDATFKLLIWTLTVNTGALWLYVLPFIVAYVLAQTLRFKSFKTKARILTAVPEKEVDKILPFGIQPLPV